MISIFISDIKYILRDVNTITIQSKVLFYHHPDCNMDEILRIKINENDVDIAFKFNNGKMSPIHLVCQFI